MLEAYWAYADFERMADLVEELICHLSTLVNGTLELEHKDAEGNVSRRISLARPWKRARYRDLITGVAGEDWFSLDLAGKRERAVECGVQISTEMADHEITQQVFEKLIEEKTLDPLYVTHLPKELVPLAKQIALRIGAIASPSSDRTHTRHTPQLGGIAIVGGFALALALLCNLSNWPQDKLVWLTAFSLAMFCVGLLDDLVDLRPRYKVLFELVAIGCAVFLELYQVQLKILVAHVGLNNGAILRMNRGGHQKTRSLRKPSSHENGFCQRRAAVIHRGV
jgi:hypothetical protein